MICHSMSRSLRTSQVKLSKSIGVPLKISPKTHFWCLTCGGYLYINNFWFCWAIVHVVVLVIFVYIYCYKVVCVDTAVSTYVDTTDIVPVSLFNSSSSTVTVLMTSCEICLNEHTSPDLIFLTIRCSLSLCFTDSRERLLITPDSLECCNY